MLCEDILREAAERHNIGVIELSMMSNHIHIIIQLPSTMSVSQALQLLKGASSYELFRQRPLFRYPVNRSLLVVYISDNPPPLPLNQFRIGTKSSISFFRRK